MNCDVLYCIKYGLNDGILSKKVKTIIHCVFDMTEPHGDVYAGVSSSLSKKFGSTLYVPHMISLKKNNNSNLKTILGIPENGIVFGRYGGIDTFDLKWCWNVIEEIVNERDDIYFLLNNTVKLKEHNQIKYQKNIVSEEDKNKFINTCDCYIECGSLGHSFGLAIGEFSVFNKPIMAYKNKNIWNRAHIDILGDNALYFENKEEFKSLLCGFRKDYYIGKDLNFYRDYSPEKVMEKFKAVFLENR